MTLTIQTKRHKLLTSLISQFRKEAGLTQADVARALRRYQSYVANIESGQRRIDVVEFLDLAAAIGFDAREILHEIMKVGTNENTAPKNPGSLRRVKSVRQTKPKPKPKAI